MGIRAKPDAPTPRPAGVLDRADAPVLKVRTNAQKAAELRKKIHAAFDANPAELVADVAARLGCSRQTIHRHRQALGLHSPRRHSAHDAKTCRPRTSKAAAGNPRKPKDAADPMRHWLTHSKAEIARHMASKKLPKGQLAGGNCDRCKYKPKAGTPFEKSPCRACPYLGGAPGLDREAKQEGHGRVVSMSHFENYLGSPGDVHGENAFAHALDHAAPMPGEEDPDPGAHGDFYATIDARLEADAPRTAENLGRTHSHTMPTDSKPTSLPPSPRVSGEASPENSPPKKPSFGDVPQEALDVFVESLADISQLNATELVAVFRRMGGAEHAETAKELGLTAAGVSSAIAKAVSKVPILGAAIKINANNHGEASKKGAASGTVLAKIESGKRHPAYARVLEMLASGELGGKIGALLTRSPLAKKGMIEAVAGMLGIPKGEPLVETVVSLIVENGLCHAVTDGRGVFYCTFRQARELRAEGKREVGPDVKGDAYPDGRPVPMLFREGAASVRCGIEECAFTDCRCKLWAVRNWMAGDWQPTDGFPGLDHAIWRGRKGAAWAFRRNGKFGIVLAWVDDGEAVKGSTVDRRLRLWRMDGNAENMVQLARRKIGGKLD